MCGIFVCMVRWCFTNVCVKRSENGVMLESLSDSRCLNIHSLWMKRESARQLLI